MRTQCYENMYFNNKFYYLDDAKSYYATLYINAHPLVK